MYYKRPEEDLGELCSVLNAELLRVKVNKEAAVKKQQFEYDSNLRMIEKRLEDFIIDLKTVESEFS